MVGSYAAAINSDDVDLAQRTKGHEAPALCEIIGTHGHRLYRLARGMSGDGGEAEDVLQEAYLRAFTHLDAFRGASSLATWLTRIVINEALGRLQKQRRRAKTIVPFGAIDNIDFIRALSGSEDPEQATIRRQTLRLVEQATGNLPEIYRIVFVTRIIDGLDVGEIATTLGIRRATVRTRLHRARVLVRQELDETSRVAPPGRAPDGCPSRGI